MMMKVACCGCGKQLGDKPSAVFDDDTVSHSLCESCAHHFQAQMGMSLTSYLEGIPAPVILLARDGSIGSVNSEARSLLHKPFDQIEGAQPGEVFECEYAMQPEGCGRTVHCSGCTIRKTITDTIETGTPHLRVQATLKKPEDSESCQVSLLISTEKSGGVVFLRVEQLG